jgi:hypothetical protein
MRKDDSMQGTPEQAIRPVRQQVTDVDQDRGAGIVLSSRWTNGNWCPSIILLQQLKTSLPLKTEKQCDGAIV